MPGPVFLEGEGVTLHPMDEEDVDFLTKTINDPDVWGSLAHYAPITEHEEREFVQSVGEENGVHLVICADGEPVGTVGLNDINDVWGVAELGYLIAPDAWGNGYATDASRRLVRYAFEDRRLNKVKANAYETNPASQRVLEKVGFEQEGLFRNHAYVRGEYVDVHRYGLLADDLE
jgi:RimJ/RimL family protein N-acetyltransferase